MPFIRNSLFIHLEKPLSLTRFPWMIFQFLCSEGWTLNQITKNTLRTTYLSMKRQSYYAFCKPSSLSAEKAMKSILRHLERQIYLATLGKQELLAMGSIFCHVWSNFMLKPAEWCPQNYDICSHDRGKKANHSLSLLQSWTADVFTTGVKNS